MFLIFDIEANYVVVVYLIMIPHTCKQLNQTKSTKHYFLLYDPNAKKNCKWNSYIESNGEKISVSKIPKTESNTYDMCVFVMKFLWK